MFNLLNKPCKAADFDKHWSNCGLRWIPFKLGQKVQSEEFLHCTCQRRHFKKEILSGELVQEQEIVSIVGL